MNDVRIITTEIMFDKLMKRVKNKDVISLLSNLDEEFHLKGAVLFGWNMIKWDSFIDKVSTELIDTLEELSQEGHPFKLVNIPFEGDAEIIDRDYNFELPYLGAMINFDYGDEFKVGKYFVLSSCNEWKEYSSFGLIGVFSYRGLIKQLEREVEKGNMELDCSKEDFWNLPIEELDSRLEYGAIQEVAIDEEY